MSAHLNSRRTTSRQRKLQVTLASTALAALGLGAMSCAPVYYDCYYYYGYYYPYCDYYYMDPYLPEDGYNPIYYREVSEEPVPHPDPNMEARLPELSLQLVNFTYVARTTDEGDASNTGEHIDEVYPCAGADGSTVICHPGNLGAPTGDMLLVAYQLEEPVPFDDATNLFVLGFSFDSDGLPENNYVPPETEQFHYFGGTDKYIAALYEPTLGWRLESADLVNGAFALSTTQARIIFEGDTVALVVPASEFVSPTPPTRASLFRHTGDFGAGGNWSGMIFPPLDEPLAGL